MYRQSPEYKIIFIYSHVYTWISDSFLMTHPIPEPENGRHTANARVIPLSTRLLLQISVFQEPGFSLKLTFRNSNRLVRVYILSMGTQQIKTSAFSMENRKTLLGKCTHLPWRVSRLSKESGPTFQGNFHRFPGRNLRKRQEKMRCLCRGLSDNRPGSCCKRSCRK